MYKEEMNIGAATALKYLAEGWVSVLHDNNGSIIGLWVKYTDWGKDEYSILTFLCSVLTVAKSKGDIDDSLPEDIISEIQLRNYRIEPNSIDSSVKLLLLEKKGVGLVTSAK